MHPGLFYAFSLCVGPCWVVIDNNHLHILPNVTLNVEMFPHRFSDTFGFDSGSMVVDPKSCIGGFPTILFATSSTCDEVNTVVGVAGKLAQYFITIYSSFVLILGLS